MFEFLYITFITVVIIQFFYSVFIFSQFAFSSVKKAKHTSLPVSIIICAKNEFDNLKQNLSFICEQNYSNFELILVNDHSTDNTLQVFNNTKDTYPNVDITIIDLKNKNLNDGKKNALTKGINKAKYDYLLLTDADCKPSSKHWISEMIAYFNKNKTIVLGYGAYQKIKKSWLNKLIRFETLQTAIQYFSYAKIGLAYMGVGRNLAYTKSDFNTSNGFTKHINIKSGDDDLFVNAIVNKKNTAICFSNDSFTISKPHSDFKKWLHQKRRHITTANHYKLKHQFLLGLFFVSQFLVWFLAIFLLIIGFKIKIILFLFFIRTGFQYLIFTFAAKKLHEKDLIIFTPFLELFLIVIQMCIFIKNLVQKPVDW